MGDLLASPVLAEIGERHGKSPAQVVLRWHIQRGDIVFPKSKTEARVRENFEIFDFELDEPAMASITALDKGEKGRTGGNPDTMDWVPTS